jgi:predicted enzyme related to lactoylglutathione lyase
VGLPPQRAAPTLRTYEEEKTMTQGPNKFIWYELMTTDQDAAEAFYRAVVGWNMADAGQPRMRYTILSAGDRGMGGLMKLPDEACEKGARPGWVGYIGVPNTDAGRSVSSRPAGPSIWGPTTSPMSAASPCSPILAARCSTC